MCFLKTAMQTLLKGGCPYNIFSKIGGLPVEKIFAITNGFCTLYVEVESPYNRNRKSQIRKGFTALADFLLSFFVEIRCKALLRLDAVQRLPI
ncbi:hypothetical protein [Enterocloster clostridioformis]|uniref:hypothetical protein n=1 Tax=Enterocloster clostridioformis TaxID=1531 RepID=UPI0011BD4C80|nr:hypothetical protein [Enterocloster clostridioformis]MCA5578508.1 hypothetical protein [Enterocloster clostridioformis]